MRSCSDTWQWVAGCGLGEFLRTWTSLPSTWCSSMWKTQDRCVCHYHHHNHDYWRNDHTVSTLPGPPPSLPSLHCDCHGWLDWLHQTSQVNISIYSDHYDLSSSFDHYLSITTSTTLTRADCDIKMSGHVTWAGGSSAEVINFFRLCSLEISVLSFGLLMTLF